MGLASDLGYTFAPPSRLHRLVQTFAATRPGGWLFSRTLRHLDDVVGRISNGRTSTPALLAGLPVLEVGTTGRRSKQRRTSHLIAVPVRDTLALLGTNFGQASTPAWVLNLEADPHASVSYRDRTVEVVARAATAAEAEEVMRSADGIYPGYRKYRERITGRRVRIFVLEPGEGPGRVSGG
jgi:deazaflavin-dependent oxidoreductase (nitroreductase family)